MQISPLWHDICHCRWVFARVYTSLLKTVSAIVWESHETCRPSIKPSTDSLPCEYYHLIGCGSLSPKKCGALNALKYDRGIWGILYVINLPSIYDIVLKIELPERSDACVRGCGSHILALSSHLCHIVVGCFYVLLCTWSLKICIKWDIKSW